MGQRFEDGVQLRVVRFGVLVHVYTDGYVLAFIVAAVPRAHDIRLGVHAEPEAIPVVALVVLVAHVRRWLDRLVHRLARLGVFAVDIAAVELAAADAVRRRLGYGARRLLQPLLLLLLLFLPLLATVFVQLFQLVDFLLDTLARRTNVIVGIEERARWGTRALQRHGKKRRLRHWAIGEKHWRAEEVVVVVEIEQHTSWRGSAS